MFIQIFKTVMLSILFGTLIAGTVSADSLQMELLKAADKKASGDYVRKRFIALMKKPFDSKTKKKALIIGDSHAKDFINVVFENGYLKNYQVSTRDIPTDCQPILGENSTKYIESKNQTLCAKSDSLGKAKAQIAKADLIVLVANWKEWSVKELPNTIKNLKLTPQQKLVVLGRKSFGKVSVRSYLRMTESKLRNLRNDVDKDQQKINALMKASLSKDVFVDVQQLVCGSASSCRVFTSDLKLISFDGGHLTKHGASYVGSILFKDSQLADL